LRTWSHDRRNRHSPAIGDDRFEAGRGGACLRRPTCGPLRRRSRDDLEDHGGSPFDNLSSPYLHLVCDLEHEIVDNA
jgi:hypothetical protein